MSTTKTEQPRGAESLSQSGGTHSAEYRVARPRRFVRVLVVVAVVSVITASAWVLIFSPLLAVKSVRVVGAEGPQADQVLAAANIPVGTPLARLDTESPRAAILALPWVSGVEVRRGWPSEVVLAVTERVPIARLTGSTSGVDASGTVFDASGGLAAGLPEVSATGAGLVTAMTVLADLPDDIGRRVTKINATTRDDVTFTLRSGAIVRWGSAEQAAAKSAVLTALLGKKRDVYDVTAPELPTTLRLG